MPYILKEENIEEFLRKSEMDEFEEEDFGEFYPDDYKMVDKSGMFEDFRFKLVVLESLLGKNASFVDEFKEFTEKLEEKYDDYVFEIGNFINPVIIEPILKFLENRSSMESGKSEGSNDILKNSDLTNFKDGWYFENENGIVSIDDISGINNKGDNKNNTDGYFALVQMDGDSLGKILGTLDEHKLKDFSEKCFDYADNASAIINEYGGKVIYAGGDDILFLAPLISNNRNQHLFSLIEEISKKFNEIFDYSNVTLSAGIFICYYKYPICEGLKSVFNLLNKSKEDGKCRTTIQLEQHSKSMGTLQLKTSFEDADVFKLFIKFPITLSSLLAGNAIINLCFLSVSIGFSLNLINDVMLITN